MAMQRSEISLQVLKNISRLSAVNEGNFFEHERRNFVSPSMHVIFFLLLKIVIIHNIFANFPEISADSPKVDRRPDKCF